MATPNPKAAQAPKPETTLERKARLRKELSDAIQQEKKEREERRAVGIVGFYGRVPSVIDAIRAANPANPVTVDALAESAERFFVTSNPDRKKSANSSRLYTGEILEALRLLGLVILDTTAKEETYKISPALIPFLSSKK